MANEAWGTSNLDFVDAVWEGYTGVDGLKGGEQVWHKGWGNMAKNRKTEPLGLNFC